MTEVGYKIFILFSIFIKRLENRIVIVALHVDDFWIFFNIIEEKETLESVLSENSRHLVQVKKCLALNIEIDKIKQELRVNQKHYFLR